MLKYLRVCTGRLLTYSVIGKYMFCGPGVINYFKEDDIMFCTNCGGQIPDGAAVCPNCGAQAAGLGNGQAAQQNFNNVKSQPVKQPLAQAKIGINCGILAMLLGVAAALGWSVAFVLIAGYIFICESDEWLKKYAGKVTKIFVIYNLIPLGISLVKSAFSVLSSILSVIDLPFMDTLITIMYRLSGFLSGIDSIVNIAFTVILLLAALDAYNQSKQ